jgi:4-azaleucine resistance transporter AzlC
MTAFTRGLRESLPIVLGYLPIAFSFGLTVVQAGLSPWLAIAASVLVYAGGSQFVLIGLLTAGTQMLTVVVTVVLMNARHLLYGATVAVSLDAQRRVPRPFLAFGLTDEVFASAMNRITSVPVPQREHWLLGMQLGAYSSWVAGTIAGAAVGASLMKGWPILQETLTFVLPALFLALLLGGDWRGNRRPIAVTVVVAGICLVCGFPGHVAILLSMISGAASGAFTRARNHD